MIQLIKDEV